MSHRRSFIGRALLVLAAGLSVLGNAAAQTAAHDWKPAKPLRLVVAYPPGGAADVGARIVGEKLQAYLGQTVTVENKAGANGLIGSQYVLGAADGFTFLVGTIDTQAINPTIYTNLSFQPTSFLAVAPIALTPTVMAGPKDKSKTAKDFVAAAKAGKLSYGHWGVGGLGHLASEMFKANTGISDMTAIPYQGSGPGSQALMGGQIDMMILPLSVAIAGADRLTVFGINASQRFEGAKNIPTLAEAGFPLEANGWVGVFAPPRTPPETVQGLAAAINAVTGDPEMTKRLRDLGMATQSFKGPAEYAAWVSSEQARWGKVIHDTGIKLTQ